MTVFAGDEWEGDDVTSGPVDGWLDAGGWDWGEPYDEGPELPPSRRVVSIETTGDRL